jgi:hypothetical protein
LILGKEIVGDQTYEVALISARVSALMRMAAMSAVIDRVGEEDKDDEEICCEICGRPGIFVRFGRELGRGKARGGFSRENL